jgi:hypothetical protein
METIIIFWATIFAPCKSKINIFSAGSARDKKPYS